MNYELFVTKRLLTAKKYKSSVSAPIIKIGIIAIALGVIVMLIAIATGIGLQKKIREKISGFNGHIQIVHYDMNQSLESLKPLVLPDSVLQAVKQMKGVKQLYPVVQKAAILKTASDFEGVVLKGVSPEYPKAFFQDFMIAGSFPVYGKKRSDSILISQNIADKLHLKTGDRAHFWFVRRKEAHAIPKVRNFYIKGIYNTGFPEFDNSYIICDIKHLQRLNKWKRAEVGSYEVLLHNFDAIESESKSLGRLLPPTLNAVTIKDKFPLIFEWISLFDSNIIVIIFIMILVAGFNMITALLVLILERTNMIGILKSLGSTDWQIRKIFLYQATYLILRGLFWGNLIGVGMLLLQKYTGVIRLNPETYYVNKAPVYLNVTYIILLNFGVVALSYLMLLIPSYFITKINPAKAIRFE